MKQILGLAYLRMKNGLTQTELAQKIGVRQGYVADLERFERKINAETKRKITQVFGWSLEDVCKMISITEEEFTGLKRRKRHVGAA